MEVVDALQAIGAAVRPHGFVGQGEAKGRKGQKQAEQQQVLAAFNSGVYNGTEDTVLAITPARRP